ncbi:phosphoribosylanthranilate isomerase [Paenarthrobacter nitroguajacolicus]|uniref:phosphoribosylanthranilate isomerase n=1 Tax=Paenarthrobacter nitroguajacolicus TaxID=211146 RepID=UPI000B85C579|nr:phosphoribosylanthranilate isomerase [Paenarthrobacter nitroguajacolicus]
MENLIQVAGIIDQAEADLLVGCGVDWLGFPLRLPSGMDDISESDAHSILRRLPADRAGVLVSYLTDADEIAKYCDWLGFSAVQLHGEVSVTEISKLRRLRPDLGVLKSLIVRESNIKELLTQVDATQEHVDMFITDTFHEATGARGATGRTHDWSVSEQLVARSERPLMLAGGLTPENVGDAIRAVQPAAVDAHTGLEGVNKRKDLDKVTRFVSEARIAFAESQAN